MKTKIIDSILYLIIGIVSAYISMICASWICIHENTNITNYTLMQLTNYRFMFVGNIVGWFVFMIGSIGCLSLILQTFFGKIPNE